jgi:hypothetical protein
LPALTAARTFVKLWSGRLIAIFLVILGAYRS